MDENRVRFGRSGGVMPVAIRRIGVAARAMTCFLWGSSSRFGRADQAGSIPICGHAGRPGVRPRGVAVSAPVFRFDPFRFKTTG